jgi:lipopolysaccharide export LptBFGC system permease protein LptF
MKNFEGIDWAVLFVFFIMIVAAGVITYSEQQQRALFQQTYNKNLECRQALKGQTVGRVNEICGDVPVIGDFVK